MGPSQYLVSGSFHGGALLEEPGIRQMPLWLDLARDGGICEEEGGVTQNVHPATCDTHTFPLPGPLQKTSTPADLSQRWICLYNHEGRTF